MKTLTILFGNDAPLAIFTDAVRAGKELEVLKEHERKTNPPLNTVRRVVYYRAVEVELDPRKVHPLA